MTSESPTLAEGFLGAPQGSGCPVPGEPLQKEEATPGIGSRQRPRVTDADRASKATPESRCPSPVPSWPHAQALSRQGVGAGSRSGLPRSHIEEDEGSFAEMGQELSRWVAEMEQKMSKISLQEQQTGPKLQPVKDSSDKELSRGAEDGAQELSQQQDDVSCSTGDKPSGPGMEEGPQPCAPAGPGSPSPAGTAVAAEAAPAPAGAAGQEEPPEPLAEQQEEKAPQSPVPSWELPSARAQSRVPAPRSSPGHSLVLEVAWRLSPEYVSPIPLEIQRSGWQPEGLRDLEQRLAVEMGETATAEREQSPVPDPLSPLSPSPAQLGALRDRKSVV